GYAVLNADDPLVFAMREHTAGRIVLFSTKPVGERANVEEHLARGGIVARVERTDQGEQFVIREAERHVVLAPVTDVPLTFEGLARFQLGNVLAAAAAAYVQGLSESEIREGLMSFVPSAGRTPGRLNVLETTRGRVMIDYAHNAAAVEGLVDFLAATPAKRRIALLSAPGDRRDDDLREIGRLAARLDVVIPKEHEVYRRGREHGAINALISEGLVQAGFPADRIVSFVEERDAVAYLMELMEPGDVAVIVADDTAAVTAQIAPYLLPG
ncbi:MAG: cyanophycin synthetase, partial [Gemmatimonadota bacterium]|nr:cyanophycin synthetase [Gemmatimonadota bacterium]